MSLAYIIGNLLAVAVFFVGVIAYIAFWILIVFAAFAVVAYIVSIFIPEKDGSHWYD